MTVTAGLFLLVYGFTMAGTHGWAAPVTMALLAGAVLMLGAFTAVELRSAHPLLPLRVVLDRNRGGSYLASLLVGSAMLGTFLFLTYYFQGSLHYSALKTGFAFLPFSGGIIMGAGLASRLLPRVGPRALMMTGLALAAGGLVWFTRLGVDSTYLGLVLPAEVMVSLGMGMTFVPMSSTALVGVEPTDAGVASALVNTTQQVGGSLGTALLNTLAATATTTFLATHALERGDGPGRCRPRLHDSLHRERGPARRRRRGGRPAGPGLAAPGADGVGHCDRVSGAGSGAGPRISRVTTAPPGVRRGGGSGTVLERGSLRPYPRWPAGPTEVPGRQPG